MLLKKTEITVLIEFVRVCVRALQTKKRYAKEWAEAEKATQQAEKTESDLNATKLDVEKVNGLFLLQSNLILIAN